MLNYTQDVFKKLPLVSVGIPETDMPNIQEITEKTTEIAKKYGVERVWLFGSYARGENTEKSDIDFRIDKGKIRGLFELCGFRNSLMDSLGKEVDVLTTQSLDDQFLNHISGEEILLYEAQ